MFSLYRKFMWKVFNRRYCLVSLGMWGCHITKLYTFDGVDFHRSGGTYYKNDERVILLSYEEL